MKKEINIGRRDFLSAMGIGTLAVAGGALVGSPAELAYAAEDASEEEAALLEADNASDPIEPVAVPDVWDAEADVVVVGAGGGGLNAAVRTLEQGGSVILLEKTGVLGGNTEYATMVGVCGGMRQQEEAQRAAPSYPFDPRAWADAMMDGYHGQCNIEALQTIANNIGPALNWMEDTFGGEEYGGWNWVLGSDAGSWVRIPYEDCALGLTPVVRSAEQYIIQNGATIMKNTRAMALVVDGDRVVGVKAEGPDGEEIYVRGANGVILTGGGFSANKDLLAKYAPFALESCLTCYVSETDSGDCLRMGLGADGVVGSYNAFAMFDGGMAYEDFGGTWCNYLVNGATQIARQPWMMIDRTGNRLRYYRLDKTNISEGALTDQANVETSTPGHRAYIVFDSNFEPCIDVFGQQACRMALTPDNPKSGTAVVPDYYGDWHNGFNDAVESGVIRKADTIEEIADLLGLDQGILVEAVNHWNENCEKGEDDAFYPYPPEWLFPIAEPPYYGCEIGGNLYCTRTGLCINNKMEVLNSKGLPIPGLYAGWMTAACTPAENTVHSCSVSSGGVSLAFLGGYLAATSAMELGSSVEKIEQEAEEEEEMAGNYAPGTYTGFGSGQAGKIEVTLTVDEGSIVSVDQITDPGETHGMGGAEAIADGTFIGQILEAQSAAIDGVSGATITSDGVRSAVKDALKQAMA